MTDRNQKIVASYVCEGFGKIFGQNGGGGGEYQFCGLWGYRNDWDAGLMHVGARYYEPEIGRWVQKDPLIIELNSYTYVDNNPINFIDSTGLSKVFDLGKGWRIHVDPHHPTHGPHVDVIYKGQLVARIGKGWIIIWLRGKIPNWVLDKMEEINAVIKTIGQRVKVLVPSIPILEILDSIINDKHPTLFSIPLPYNCKPFEKAIECPYCSQRWI